MSEPFSIFIVDDAEATRRVLESAFSAQYTVESFASAEECLERLKTGMPNLFLLDVDLPGMNGFDLCRQIRAQETGQTRPVIFISALDDLDSRLEGYKAGGTDFMVKPYKLAEVKQKVEVTQRAVLHESMLHLRVAEANTMTSTVMSSLGEYAGLLNFLRELNYCENYRAIAEAFLGLLAVYQLRGAVQLRIQGQEYTFSPEGENQPLAISVIRKVREMGRVVEFKQHAAYNYESTSILVNSMPLDDPDLCGRIRDNLCIAAESIDAKLGALETAETMQKLKLQQAEEIQEHTQSEITTLLLELQATIESFRQKYATAQQAATAVNAELQSKLLSAFAYLGLSEEQEANVLSLVHDNMETVIRLYNFNAETQQTLANLAERLHAMQH
ncbi:response regulator [Uliginosibacterium gangwonense]|uniref:response regulator n=1 Tax=Uliginosibacterium gangwonense TaxID=392736 RepID=UPI000372959B|nr:response regulator [Uliginosibacterium gangwonense]